MSQHDYVIANGTGAAVRSDLNNALAAIVSQNSGATEPATMYAYQWWADTTTGLLKLRNGANNAWITLRELDGTLTIEDGTAGSPGLAFADDLNTGIYSPGADQVAISTGGTARLTATTTGITSALPVGVPLGSASAPTVTFTGDLNTGIYSPGADQVAISTGGTSRLFVSSAGLVGIGTSSPIGLLQLGADGSGVIIDNTFSESSLPPADNNSYIFRSPSSGSLNFRASAGAPTGGVYKFWYGSNVSMIIDSSQRVGIGTTASNANGGILQLSGGITFPATAVAASDPNTLDDYEEGTWTPTVRGSATAGTYQLASHLSHYTKIGRTVQLTSRITLAASITGGGVGDLWITGVPFAKQANEFSVGSVLLNNVDYGGVSQNVLWQSEAANSVLNIAGSNDNAAYSITGISGIAANDIIILSITYNV